MKKLLNYIGAEFNILAIVVLIVILLAGCPHNSNAQCEPGTDKGVFVYAGVGSSKGYFSHELHAGYQINKLAFSAGYVSIPNNTQPVFFQLRGGYVLAERLYIYAGVVRVTYNIDDKSRNYNTYSLGIQYHTLHYDRGTVYYTLHYSPGYISAGVGMSYNFIKKQ